MHPDAIIAIAAAKESKALTAEIFGDDIGWLETAGYELGLWLGLPGQPQCESVVLKPRPLHVGG